MRAYNLTAEDGFKAAALFIFLFLVFQLGGISWAGIGQTLLGT